MIFLSLALLVLAIPGFAPIRVILLLSLLFLYSLTLVYGAARISSQFFLKAFCKGKPDSKKIAITFDDGPFGERSGEILELLRKHNCPASFFLIGHRVEEDPETVKMMIRDGHLLGNHSYSHSNFFPFFGRARIREELERTKLILESAGSGPVKFFRPPFGVSNPNVAGGVMGTGMKVAGWSIRSFDTRNQAADRVVQKILRQMGGGDVILLHETSGHILEILEQLLPAIKKAGLSCARLDEMSD